MKTENNYLSTIQWFIYLLANSIALPIVIGNMYHLSEQDISSLMQRTFFIVGLSSFLQAKFGHRYPIADGPAGSWVSIFVIYASVGLQQGNSMMETLQILEGGLIIAGLALLLLGITKWVRHLLFLFSPIVTGTFLFILAIQLSGVFIIGITSTSTNDGKLDIISFLISLLVFLLILLMNLKGKGWIKSYSILLGILLGWTMFAVIGKGPETSIVSSELIKLPEVLAWGLPKLNEGMMVTAILFTFLLLSNTFAAITAAQEVVPHKESNFEKKLYAGTWTGGISHVLSAIFSTIAVVPLPATAGFVKLTKQYRILPFLVACMILISISLFPSIVGILASLPLQIASAALLATLIEMLAIAIRSLRTQALNERNLTIIGVAFLVGIGIIFLPSGTFNGLPSIFQHLFTNGLLVGTFVAMVLDQLWKNVDSIN